MFQFLSDSFAAFFETQTEENEEELSLHVFSQMPREILIMIGRFWDLNDLLVVAQVDSFFLRMFFNQNMKKIEKCLVSKKKYPKIGKIHEYEDHYVNIVDLYGHSAVQKVYREEELVDKFQTVQELIWKPLVLKNYWKFNAELPIKNWMHVLRRRKSLKKENSGVNVFDNWERCCGQYYPKFIENCSKIYECPVEYTILPMGNSCDVCNKKVEMLGTFSEERGSCAVYGEIKSDCYYESE